MFSSRKIDDLATPAKIKALMFLAKAKDAGIDVLVTCTVRDAETQNALYARGRTRAQLDAAGLAHVESAPGPIVTNAKSGDSYHQYACAFDVVPLRDGKPVWNTSGADGELWARLGAIGEAGGLEWAGRWHGHMREMAHFQYTGGIALADFRAGKRLTNGALA
jgi:peptidoglycan L-alanyl-D-glutamate endopeptidase CwlK